MKKLVFFCLAPISVLFVVIFTNDRVYAFFEQKFYERCNLLEKEIAAAVRSHYIVVSQRASCCFQDLVLIAKPNYLLFVNDGNEC